MAWLSGYNKRIKVTADHTKVGSNLSWFPLTIFLKSGDGDTTKIFDELGSNNLKMAITKSDGTTQLYVEIEQWDTTNKVGVLHCGRDGDTLSSSADTDYYIYYDSSHADNTDYVGVKNSTPAQSVWDGNFKAIYHMSDGADTSHIYDSTSNNNDGAKKASNEPIQADGQIAKAQDFDGTNDYINCGTPTITGTFTVEAWAKVSDNNNRQIVGTRSPNECSFDFKFISGNKIHGDIGNGSKWITITADASFSYSLNTWYHIVYVVTTTGYTIYANGNQVGSGSYSSTTPIFSDANHKITIGAYLGSPPSEYFYGTIDEVRISNTARSAAWIKASYNSENNSLVSYGSEEAIITNRRRLLII